MRPFEALTEEDKQMIADYITAYNGSDACYGTLDCSLEHLLRFWNCNKQDLFNIFKNHLIHEKDICIQTPEAILSMDMEESIFGLKYQEPIKFVKQFNTWMQELYEANNRDYTIFDYCNSILGNECLIKNAYPWEDFVIPVPDDSAIKVVKGMKPMKIINKIIKKFPNAFTQEAVEEFRIKHSMVLNQKMFKGTMCLSIHPMDFMTMSDNDCNWDSCMSWQKPGEYRMGTVEMMNSHCIVIAYLKGSKDMSVPIGKTWNNKRWRELFIVDKNILTHIKGYPYRDKALTDIAFDWLNELIADYGWKYMDGDYTVDKNEGSPVEFGDYQLYFHPQFAIMYDDYYSKHRARFGAKLLDEIEPYDKVYRFDLWVSGNTECMCCGSDWSGDYEELDTQSLQCPTCSGEVRCPNCGEHYDYDDMYTLGDGTQMCRDCFEYYGRECDCCNEVYHRDDTEMVYARHLNQTLDDKICMCRECRYSDGNGTLGPILLRTRTSSSLYRSYWGTFYQADTENFTSEGYELFGFTDEEEAEMRAEIAEYNEQEKS